MFQDRLKQSNRKEATIKRDEKEKKAGPHTQFYIRGLMDSSQVFKGI